MTQTSPSYTPVCPGDRLVLTCVASGTGNTFWKHSSTDTAIRLNQNTRSATTGIDNVLVLGVTDIADNTVTSTGTIETVDISLNGTMISCTATLSNEAFVIFTIKMTG